MLVYDIVSLGVGVLIYVIVKDRFFPSKELTLHKLYKSMSDQEIRDMNWFIKIDLNLNSGAIVESSKYLESAKKYLKQKN